MAAEHTIDTRFGRRGSGLAVTRCTLPSIKAGMSRPVEVRHTVAVEHPVSVLVRKIEKQHLPPHSPP